MINCVRNKWLTGCSFFLLLNLTMFSSFSAADDLIDDFDSSKNESLNWRIVDDRVMGGRSQGLFSTQESGIMRFEGMLSLENNGGFSSVRTDKLSLDLSDKKGLALRVKGDGRKYQLRLSTDARFRSYGEVSFKAEFETVKDEWIEIKVPFNSLVGSWRGRNLEDEVFNPAKIERISLLLGDKNPGKFQLDVDWIRDY